MNEKTYRLVQGLLLLLSILVLGAGFYLQYARGLQPCPLCLMQRFCIFLLTLFCLMGACLSMLKRGRMVAILQMLGALGGLFFAGRQLWLQSLPVGQAPACIPDLDVLIRYFPWKDVFHALVWGAGDCAEVTWKLLGLSMAAWGFLYFLMMLVAGAVVFFLLSKPLGKAHRNR
jgi:disulfide bond formation protein DsbB